MSRFRYLKKVVKRKKHPDESKTTDLICRLRHSNRNRLLIEAPVMKMSLFFFLLFVLKLARRRVSCQITSGVKWRRRLVAAVTLMSFTACFLFRGFTLFNLSPRLRPGDGPLSGAAASAAHKLKQDDFSFFFLTKKKH